MVPDLFNTYLAAVTLLPKGTFTPDDRIHLRHRFDGSVFNPKRLKAKTKMSCTTVQ